MNWWCTTYANRQSLTKSKHFNSFSKIHFCCYECMLFSSFLYTLFLSFFLSCKHLPVQATKAFFITMGNYTHLAGLQTAWSSQILYQKYISNSSHSINKVNLLSTEFLEYSRGLKRSWACTNQSSVPGYQYKEKYGRLLVLLRYL